MGTAPKPGGDGVEEGHTATKVGAKGGIFVVTTTHFFWPGHNSLPLSQKYMKPMQAWGSPGSPHSLSGIIRAHNRFNPPAGAFGITLQFLSTLLPCPGQTSLDNWLHPPCLHPSVPSCALCQGMTWAVPFQCPPKHLLTSEWRQACSSRQAHSKGDGLIFKSQFKAAQKRLYLKGIQRRLNLHPGSEMQNPISHPLMMETSIRKKASQARSNRQPQRPPADAQPPLPAPITATFMVHSRLCEPPSPACSPMHKYAASCGPALTPTCSGGAI